MKLRVVAVVTVQVMGVAVAYGATRMGTFFAPSSTPSPSKAAAQVPLAPPTSSAGPATSNNAPPANQDRSWPQAWGGSVGAAELADPWPPRATAGTWDERPALEIIEPWGHQHVVPAIAIVDPWPGNQVDAADGETLATQSRDMGLIVDPWVSSKPIPPTKAFPLLPGVR